MWIEKRKQRETEREEMWRKEKSSFLEMGTERECVCVLTQ
jgi:hypothetical protein